MVVVAIVALLAAIAYPSYQSQIRKARRSVAKTALVEAASRQEQFFQDRKTYTAVLTDLGYSADPFYLDKDGNTTAAGSTSRIYQIDITAAGVNTFAIAAVPQAAQAGDSCGTLTLNQAGVKGAGGTVSDCW
jgi:type IV pilus assembly protein PilE